MIYIVASSILFKVLDNTPECSTRASCRDFVPSTRSRLVYTLDSLLSSAVCAPARLFVVYLYLSTTEMRHVGLSHRYNCFKCTGLSFLVISAAAILARVPLTMMGCYDDAKRSTSAGLRQGSITETCTISRQLCVQGHMLQTSTTGTIDMIVCNVVALRNFHEPTLFFDVVRRKHQLAVHIPLTIEAESLSNRCQSLRPKSSFRVNIHSFSLPSSGIQRELTRHTKRVA